ncbi:hypothetical protein DL95DRAFT_507057 [Leptodontidium sp. 2 PMI_412]|nr:hypothetical protein DL95DRAFT_507057 [Leptodontidium sp. 2 PMI_412]
MASRSASHTSSDPEKSETSDVNQNSTSHRQSPVTGPLGQASASPVNRMDHTNDPQSSAQSTYGLHKNVYALLMRWEEDDPETTSSKLGSLEDTLRTQHRFVVKSFTIPLKNPYPAIQAELGNLKNGEFDPKDLVIVYYFGHGGQQDNMSFRMSCVPDFSLSNHDPRTPPTPPASTGPQSKSASNA